MTVRTIGATAALTALLSFGGYAVYDSLNAPAAPAATTVRTAAPAPQQTKIIPVLVRTTDRSEADAPKQGRKATTSSKAGSSSKGRVSNLRHGNAGRSEGRRSSTLVLVERDSRRGETEKVAREDAQQGIRQLIATDGSIILVGDNAQLIANTGATSRSGVVALGVDGSQLTSGTSRSSAADQPASHGNGSLASLVSGQGGSGKGKGKGSAAVSGFEDHSISVQGDNQIVTYDDSNVFIGRDGQINANTGDTDSSGLNAVDVTDSTVKAGDSGDGEEAEENESENEGNENEADENEGSAQTATGSDDDQAGDVAGDDEDDAPPAKPRSNGLGSTSGTKGHTTVTDEGESTADGEDSLVVGADGFDDVSVRTHGNGDVVTYDDSNLVIGGTGNVNAQVGDSDTGGTVVMGIHNSNVSGGCEGDLCQHK